MSEANEAAVCGSMAAGCREALAAYAGGPGTAADLELLAGTRRAPLFITCRASIDAGADVGKSRTPSRSHASNRGGPRASIYAPPPARPVTLRPLSPPRSLSPRGQAAVRARLGEKLALLSTLEYFDKVKGGLKRLEYYQERRLKSLRLLDETGKSTFDEDIEGMFKRMPGM